MPRIELMLNKYSLQEKMVKLMVLKSPIFVVFWFYFFFIFFVFCLFRAAPMAYGDSQARGQI